MSKVVNKKLQRMHDSLQGIYVVIGSSIYRNLAPKRLVRAHEKAKERESKGKQLTAMEKTRLYGYLNPCYRAASCPRKITY